MKNNERVAMRYIDNANAAYSVDWYMTKRCNFSCSYCAEYLHDNYSESPPLDKMKMLVDIIEKKHGNNILWSLTGGEPMVVPHFQEILKYIAKSNPVNVSITTNGSVPTKKYIEAYENGLDNITLSMHFEHIENRIDEYVERILELENFRKSWNKKNNMEKHLKSKRLVARFMAYPGAMHVIDKMHKIFQDAGVEKIEFRNIRPQVGTGQDQMPTKKLDIKFDHSKITDISILHTESTSNRVTKTVERLQEKIKKSELAKNLAERHGQWYNTDEKAQLNQIYKKVGRKALECYYRDGTSELVHYNELTLNKLNNFKGFKCWAGAMHMKISPTGDIYIGSCHVGGKLGNIFELQNTFVLPDEPIICPKIICSDNLDLRVPKALPGYEHLIEQYVSKK